jgi:hypothetical protein
MQVRILLRSPVGLHLGLKNPLATANRYGKDVDTGNGETPELERAKSIKPIREQTG